MLHLATLLVLGTAAESFGEWTMGTYITGYWDCCKPSCAWPGKGNVNRPVRMCDANSGVLLSDSNSGSVCNGGPAASCTDQQPWIVNDGLSMGFAAAAVGGIHGLSGDANCGHCFELQFMDSVHDPWSWGGWGGSHPEVVGKVMVIQVTNIGYDVNGEHSFDLQIPGAGQGAFTGGCSRQSPGYASNDFDCDLNYGGCTHISGCSRLPPVLQRGCRWRFEWFKWLISNGQTNNPYIRFRRVQCPAALTDISGTVPLDDHLYPVHSGNNQESITTSGSLSGCSGCNTTTEAPRDRCASWCSRNPNPWSAKCTWEKCRGCGECVTTTLKPEQQCASWCSENSEPWSAKCTWQHCHGCSDCIASTTAAPTTPAYDQHCAFWCNQNSEPWSAKCMWYDCRGCTDCTPTTTAGPCVSKHEDCRQSKCCSNPVMQCYEKDQNWASCRESCEPGAINPEDPQQFQTPWSCTLLSISTASTTNAASSCSGLVQDCRVTKCCHDRSLTCYEKNYWWAECKASCTPGIDMTDAPEHRSPWSCVSLSATTTSTTASAPPSCSGLVEDCRSSRCCTNLEFKCFEKDQWWAECKASCTPGIDMTDAPEHRSPWSCVSLFATTSSTTAVSSPVCSNLVEDCRSTRCCNNPRFKCFEKDEWWAECKASCTQGVDMTDAPEFRNPWSCTILQVDDTSPRLLQSESEVSEPEKEHYLV